MRHSYFSAKNHTANAPVTVQEAKDLPVEDLPVRPGAHSIRLFSRRREESPKSRAWGFFKRVRGFFAAVFG